MIPNMSLRVLFSGEGRIQFSDATRIDYLTATFKDKKNLEAILDVAFYLVQPISVKVFDRTQPRILCLFNSFKKTIEKHVCTNILVVFF